MNAEIIEENGKRDLRLYLDERSIESLYSEARKSRLSASAFARVLFRIMREERYSGELRKRIAEIILEESGKV